MEILEVTASQYKAVINNPIQNFNSAEFSDLNKAKCDAVYYLLFKDSKYRLGINFGVRNNILLTPFSASFGGFEFVYDDIKLYQIDAAIEALLSWAKQNKFNGIKILPPPAFYSPNFTAKITNCLYRAGFEIKNVEVNYHFETHNLNDNYLQNIWYNARKNLNKSLKNDLKFTKLTPEDSHKAYEVIAQNRSERGFPLRLTYEQLQETGTIIPIDYFLVSNPENNVAAAIVFHLSKTIVRVVYWGDLPKFSELKTMNFLSYNVFQYYKEIQIPFIDIGHSTVDSVPNHGLCEFKESIGCSIGLLNEYYKKLN